MENYIVHIDPDALLIKWLEDTVASVGMATYYIYILHITYMYMHTAQTAENQKEKTLCDVKIIFRPQKILKNMQTNLKSFCRSQQNIQVLKLNSSCFFI